MRHNLETMHEAGATIAGLRSSGGGAAGALWPQIVSDVTGLAQDVRDGPSQAGLGAALFAAVAAGEATLQTSWPQPTVRVEPDPEAAAPLRRAVRVVPRARGHHAPRRPRARGLAAGRLSWHDVAGDRLGTARSPPDMGEGSRRDSSSTYNQKPGGQAAARRRRRDRAHPDRPRHDGARRPRQTARGGGAGRSPARRLLRGLGGADEKGVARAVVDRRRGRGRRRRRGHPDRRRRRHRLSCWCGWRSWSSRCCLRATR